MPIDDSASLLDLIRHPDKLRDALALLRKLERLKVQTRDSEGRLTISPLLISDRNAIIDLTFEENAVAVVPPPVPVAGPVAYWPMDEASGDAVDSAGNNDLTNTAVTYAAGHRGNAAVFNGTSAQLLRTHGTLDGLRLVSAFSFAFWLKIAAQPTGTTYVILGKFKYIGSDDRQYALIYEDDAAGGFNFAVNLSNNGTSSVKQNFPTTLPTGVWTHVVATYDGATSIVAFWLNGVLVNSYNSGMGNLYPGTADFILGNFSGVALWLNGALDDVVAYNRVITAAEIAALYNGGAGAAP
jgi:hypothetical protein